MLKKILIVLFCCCICSISYAVKLCETCGLPAKKSRIERWVNAVFDGDWDKAVKHYAEKAHKDKGARCVIDHLYCSRYGWDWERQQKIVQDIADKMNPPQKAQIIEPAIITIAEENAIFEMCTEQLLNRKRSIHWYHIDEVLESLSKKYKIKGKNGKEILVRAQKTLQGYVVLIDKAAAWKHFSLPSEYKDYKRQKISSYMLHPYDQLMLIPVSEYDKFITMDKFDHFIKICQQLGATSVSLGYISCDGKKIHFEGGLEAAVPFVKFNAEVERIVDRYFNYGATREIKFAGVIEPRDPRKDEKLKLWIAGERDLRMLCERRLDLNPTLQEQMELYIDKKHKFAFDFKLNVKVLWWTAVKASFAIEKEEIARTAFGMAISFPGGTVVEPNWWDRFKSWFDRFDWKK